MTPVSLSVAFAPYQKTSPADVALAKPAPAEAQPKRVSEGYDTPRQSPLFRALVETLGSVVASLQAPGTKTVEAPTPAAVPVAAAAAAGSSNDVKEIAEPVAKPVSAPAENDDADRPVDLEQVVLKFAKALMHVMRGALHGEEGRKGHGHQVHHHHHDHAKWGDPAQRIEQVAVKVGATLPVEPPAEAAPAAVVAAPAIVSPPIAVVDDVAEPLPTQDLPRGSGVPSTMIHVKLSINDLTPATAPTEQAEQSLVNAFATLRKALGADEDNDRATVREQLSNFLRILAEQLRTGEIDADQATQPGALLHVTA